MLRQKYPLQIHDFLCEIPLFLNICGLWFEGLRGGHLE